jgi:acyl carrier protein
VSHQTHLDPQAILFDLVLIIEDITRDWELSFSGGITPQTDLILDLTFQSIDVVQLMVAIEEKWGRRNLQFEKFFMVDGQHVDELRVKQIVDFLCEQLSEN